MDDLFESWEAETRGCHSGEALPRRPIWPKRKFQTAPNRVRGIRTLNSVLHDDLGAEAKVLSLGFSRSVLEGRTQSRGFSGHGSAQVFTDVLRALSIKIRVNLWPHKFSVVMARHVWLGHSDCVAYESLLLRWFWLFGDPSNAENYAFENQKSFERIRRWQ